MSIENMIADLTAQRDALAAQIKAALDAAAFERRALNEQQAKDWINQTQSLLGEAHALP